MTGTEDLLLRMTKTPTDHFLILKELMKMLTKAISSPLSDNNA